MVEMCLRGGLGLELVRTKCGLSSDFSTLALTLQEGLLIINYSGFSAAVRVALRLFSRRTLGGL